MESATYFIELKSVLVLKYKFQMSNLWDIRFVIARLGASFSKNSDK